MRGFVLGVSSRLAEAFSHNVIGRADLTSDRKLGARGNPDNLNLSPSSGIPYPK